MHIRSNGRLRSMIKKLVLIGLSLFLLSSCSSAMALFSQNSAGDPGGKTRGVQSTSGIKIHFGDPAPVVPKSYRIAFPDRRDENNPANNRAVEFKDTWHF